MFNQITKCITICRFYQQLVQLLTRYYQFDFLKPILHTAPLIDSTVATVTIFYFELIIVCGGTRSGHNGTRGMTVAAMIIGAQVG